MPVCTGQIPRKITATKLISHAHLLERCFIILLSLNTFSSFFSDMKELFH